MKAVTTREEAEKAEAKKRAQRQQELADLRAVLETKQGRRFIKRFLDKGRVFSPIYTTGADIYRNAARHDFCLEYLSDVLTVYPDALTIMQREASAQETKDA